MSRDHIPVKVQLAAALLQLARLELSSKGLGQEEDQLYQHSKIMTADQIISLFHRDHYPIRKVDGGPDAPWNITWRFIAAHREKTRKIDQPEIAKGRKLTASQTELQHILTKPAGHRRKRSSRWPKRPFGRSRQKKKSRR